MNKKITVLLTGGHVTPALAVMETLKEKNLDIRLIYVGREHTGATESVEKTEIKVLGAEFVTITFGKIHRFWTARQIIEFIKMPLGFGETFWLLMKFKPKVVISFGGYVSVPVVFVAKLMKIPILIHEQTAAWGVANKLMVKMADKVAVSWPSLHRTGKTILTGNPIRKGILDVSRNDGKGKALYISGGNQGSRTIDEAIKPLLPELVKRYVVFHQTQQLNLFHGKNYFSARWFDTPRHVQIMSQAALSISRAGANTVIELAFMGIPAILIPLPHAGANEQLKNAGILAETGLGRILTQKLLTTDSLGRAIKQMEITQDWEEARKNAKKLVKTDAADLLAEIAIKLACGE